jgi:hypothetical protein
MPVMNERCDACDYKFDREPGYFLGAMYISYGIAVLVAVITYLLCRIIFPAWPLAAYPLAIVFTIIAIAKKNYRLSRIIYIHIFPW